jgi:hypothetical protein
MPDPKIIQQTNFANAIQTLPREEALSRILDHFVAAGIAPAEAMIQLFKAVVIDMNLAIRGLQALSAHLVEDDQTWIGPWIEEAIRVAHVAETHAETLKSKSVFAGGTNRNSPAWSGSTCH